VRSDAALASAVQYARAQDLTLCFLQVEGSRLSLRDDRVAAAEKESLAHAEARVAAAGLAHNATLATGTMASAMPETAAMPPCDAIVVGSRGFTGWKRLMLGSMTGTGATPADRLELTVQHGGSL
jgi:nucleotide-binding universal stress UspA family protein